MVSLYIYTEQPLVTTIVYYYSVKFYQKEFPKEKGPYGIKYGFYLEDSIDKRDEYGRIKYVEEYLVIFENFVKLCKEYDLHLVEKKNFTEFYEEQIENSFYRNMFRKMIQDLYDKTKDKQWEIIQLYQIFVFRKGEEKKQDDSKKNKYQKGYIPVLQSSRMDFKDYNPVFIEEGFE